MSQLSGSIAVEVDLDRFAERLANRVVELLAERATSGGTAVADFIYDREPGPGDGDPGSGRRGVRHGVVGDDGSIEPAEGEDPGAWQ